MFWPNHMMGFGWGGWIIGGLMMLLFWGGLIALAFFANRAFSKTNQPQNKADASETTLEILNKRYAQGDIDKAEYDAKRRDITT